MSNQAQLFRSILRVTKTPRLSKELASKASQRGIDTKQRSRHAISSYFAQQFRRDDGDEVANSLRLKMAQDFNRMRSDLAERARLHALDTGAEVVLSPQEMSRRAAARAGLQLPKLDPTLQ